MLRAKEVGQVENGPVRCRLEAKSFLRTPHYPVTWRRRYRGLEAPLFWAFLSTEFPQRNGLDIGYAPQFCRTENVVSRETQRIMACVTILASVDRCTF